MSMGINTGFWTTDAPLGTTVTQEHGQVLEKITDALIGLDTDRKSCHVNRMELYVDGVLWRYETVDVIG